MDERRDDCMMREKGKAKANSYRFEKIEKQNNSTLHVEKFSFAFILTRDSLLNEIIIIILIIIIKY